MQAVADPGEGEERLHSQAKIIHVRDNAQHEKYRKCFASSVGGTFQARANLPGKSDSSSFLNKTMILSLW